MYKVIGRDNREYGPADAEQIRKWIVERRVTSESRAQEVGHEDWKPLGDFPEFADAVRSAQAVPTGVTIPPVQTTADGIADQVLSRQPHIDIGSCISRGFDLVMNNFGLVVGGTLVAMLISCVPVLGFLVNGALYGGLYFMFLKRIRGEQASVGDVFAGFGPRFLALFLASIVISILTSLGMILCILPGIYLAVAWVFAIPLVMDRDYDFWLAMEVSRKVVHKYWWTLFGLLLLAAIIGLLGIIACLVGIFVTLPIAFAAIAYAYEDLFGRTTQPGGAAVPGAGPASA